MHSREKYFSLRFDDATRHDLDKLADRWRCSRAEAVRRVLINAATHCFNDHPLCADGARCYVPQMHAKHKVSNNG